MAGVDRGLLIQIACFVKAHLDAGDQGRVFDGSRLAVAALAEFAHAVEDGAVLVDLDALYHMRVVADDQVGPAVDGIAHVVGLRAAVLLPVLAPAMV